MDQQARVASLFDRVADDYDDVGVDFFQPIAAGLVAELAPQPGERAVDIGCGRGAALLPIAAAVGSAGTAIGVDLSPRMAELAARAAAAAGVAVDIRVGDAMNPPVPPASVDVVSSSLVLFFLPDPLVALRAWRLLLVDGGRIGVTTFGPYDERWRETVDAELRVHAPPAGADARTTGQQGPFQSDEGMEDLLREAGFRDVRTSTATVSPRFADPEHWHRWSMSVGQRQFWEAIPDVELEAVRASIFTVVEGCRDAEGRIGFDQQVRYTLGCR